MRSLVSPRGWAVKSSGGKKVEQAMPVACEKCGHTLSSTGLCSRCLLQLGQQAQEGQEGMAPTSAHRPVAAYAARDSEELAKIRSLFPQYEVVELIGRGGMGAVYRAKQKSLDRTVAIKIIQDAVGDPTFAERFSREAKALARLSHPNIVTVHDFGRNESFYYLVMEFVEGVNLRQAIAARALEAGDALRVVEQVCQALQFAHSRGVVHRDIKPENILLTEDGTVKIADFGLAKLMDDNRQEVTLTATRQVMGTLAYMAPEQIDNSSRVDHRADIYSLGVVFYELLTGHLPLGRFEPPSALGQGIDQRVDPVVMKTLSRQPIDRYQAASELQSDVSRIVTEEVVPQPYWQQPLDPPAKPLNPPGRTHFADHGSWESDPGVSVPFKVRDVYAGFAEGYGRLTLYDDRVRLEWKVKDVMFGVLETSLHEKEIPLDEFSRIQIKKDYGLMVRLQLVSRSLGGLDPLPQREPGTTRLAIARGDIEAVRDWIQRHAMHPAFVSDQEGPLFGAGCGTNKNNPWAWVIPVLVAVVFLPMVVKKIRSSVSSERGDVVVDVTEGRAKPTLSVVNEDGVISYLHVPMSDIRIDREAEENGREAKQILIERNSLRRGQDWITANRIDDQSNIELRIEDRNITLQGRLIDKTQGDSASLVYVIEDFRSGAAAKLRELISGKEESGSKSTSKSE